MVSTAAGRAPVQKAASGEQSNPAMKQKLIFSLLLAVVILGFYNPVSRNGFVFFDDSVYLIKNSAIHGGLTWATVKWSFSTFYASNWHPLTWLSHALDYQLFGLNPAGHHYVSLLFHAGNAVLVFLILETATGLLWPSLIVAAAFGLHPLTVESVAWAAERKNVLSMFFCLLALRSYTKYAKWQVRLSYVFSLVWFTLALLAKPQVISLPILLFLWDYWPLGRLEFGRPGENEASKPSVRPFMEEKLPFLGLSALSAIVTLVAQHAGNSVRNLVEMPFPVRLENCVVSYARYLGLLFWPAKLAPMYPYPGSALLPWQVASSAALLCAITAVVIRQRKRRYLIVGWLWFLIALVPMIGLIQVGEQAMADRYVYLSSVGLFVAVVWTCRALVLRCKVPAMAWAVPAGAAMIALGVSTHHQLVYWHDGETLWRYTLSVTDRNYMAHDNLAMVLAEQGRSEEAIAEFRAAEALHQYPASQIVSLGDYEQSHGHLRGAIEQYMQAVKNAGDPAVIAGALDRAARAEAIGGDPNRAAQTFDEALAVKANDPDALAGSGMIALRVGNSGLAVKRLDQLVRVAPGDVTLLLLAGALRQNGRQEEADKAEEQAHKISSNYSQARETARQFAAQYGVNY